MPELTELRLTCKRCARTLEPGTLVCTNCKTLVHADEMEHSAAQARLSESRGDLQQAHQQWMAILPLLPGESEQAEWIRGHIRELGSAAANAHHPQSPGTKKSFWAKRLAPLAPLAIVAAKAKTFLVLIFKLKFLFSFAAFIGLYWAAWGPKFGIGFAVLILIHELGHFVEIKRRGLPAEMPVFLPGLGAYVRWQAMGVTQETRAAISLAGPLAGFLSAALCGVIAVKAGDPIWFALARTGAWLNILNLIPVWVLDGAGAMMPLNPMEKFLVAVVSGVLGYATAENAFYFVAAGTLFNLAVGAFARSPLPGSSVTRLGLEASGNGEAVQSGGPYSTPIEQPRKGSPLIAAYFIAVLAALGAVMYMVPGHGSGLP